MLLPFPKYCYSSGLFPQTSFLLDFIFTRYYYHSCDFNLDISLTIRKTFYQDGCHRFLHVCPGEKVRLVFQLISKCSFHTPGFYFVLHCIDSSFPAVNIFSESSRDFLYWTFFSFFLQNSQRNTFLVTPAVTNYSHLSWGHCLFVQGLKWNLPC